MSNEREAEHSSGIFGGDWPVGPGDYDAQGTLDDRLVQRNPNSVVGHLEPSAPTVIGVKAMLDSEAGVWIVESSDLPGLHVEAGTLEELVKKLPTAIEDLLAEMSDADAQDKPRDVPIELVAYASIKAKIRAAA